LIFSLITLLLRTYIYKNIVNLQGKKNNKIKLLNKNNIIRKLTTVKIKKMNFMNPESVYNLSNIRQDLIRMEDTIIFNLIERADFPIMPSIYEKDSRLIKFPNFNGSFLDWIFQQHESIQSQCRRYQSPDQYPFYPNVIKESVLPNIKYPKLLANYFRDININNEIMNVYINEIIPRVANDGEEGENFGSAAMMDISTLQSLSRRIHFGMFVAEAKFQENRELYKKLIKENDIDGIIENITNSAVEEKILNRLLIKARTYGTDPTAGDQGTSKIHPEAVVKIYKDLVIPLTKKVEVDYLLRRLEDEDF
jgi:chorismate mutase